VAKCIFLCLGKKKAAYQFERGQRLSVCSLFPQNLKVKQNCLIFGNPTPEKKFSACPSQRSFLGFPCLLQLRARAGRMCRAQLSGLASGRVGTGSESGLLGCSWGRNTRGGPCVEWVSPRDPFGGVGCLASRWAPLRPTPPPARHHGISASLLQLRGRSSAACRAFSWQGKVGWGRQHGNITERTGNCASKIMTPESGVE